MNRRIQRRWLSALRSGKYKQTFHTLMSTDIDGRPCHCALGVLCASLPPGFGKWNGERGSITYKDIESMFGLPQSLMTKIGLTIDEHKKICQLNDSRKWTFDKIADYIERKIPAS